MRISRQLKTYRIEDPPVKWEKGTPLGIIHSTVSAADTSSDHKTHNTANLIVLGFYFCLRLCEYTKGTSHHMKVLFRPLMEFVFFIDDPPPPDVPFEWSKHITQIILILDNQKNVSNFRSE